MKPLPMQIKKRAVGCPTTSSPRSARLGQSGSHLLHCNHQWVRPSMSDSQLSFSNNGPFRGQPQSSMRRITEKLILWSFHGQILLFGENHDILVLFGDKYYSHKAISFCPFSSHILLSREKPKCCVSSSVYFIQVLCLF